MHHEWYRPLGEFNVSWETRGDEWISRIMSHVITHRGVNGYQTGGTAGMEPVLELTVTLDASGTNSDTRLLLICQPEEQISVLACGNDVADEGLITAFIAALESAMKEIREPVKNHKWSAIIGEMPAMFHSNPKKLSSALTLEGLKLSSTERYFWQSSPQLLPSFNSRQIHVSVPIIVRGTSVGHDWIHAAQPQAGKTLASLVAFLSVIWNVLIDVQEAPAPLEWGERQLPEQDPWMRELDADTRQNPGLVDALEQPEWIKDAWILMNRRAKIKSAISMYMEGLRVEDRHPSLGLVAYVAAVEAISLMIFKEERCESCSNHLDVGSKFLETLKLVTDEQDRETLRPIYGNRSHTVHRGKLHGTEISLGTSTFSALTRDELSLFKWQSVETMKKSARKLLIMALRDQLPRRKHYTKPDCSE
ncbi:hypothetical protein [Streptomyces anulatus]|uniref:hypothetical protein n=1 Tax=Streptomyces anulatus TaxID=1892 RepID=UPI00343175BF